MDIRFGVATVMLRLFGKCLEQAQQLCRGENRGRCGRAPGHAARGRCVSETPNVERTHLTDAQGGDSETKRTRDTARRRLAAVRWAFVPGGMPATNGENAPSLEDGVDKRG